ncbi:unnamed protein product [Calicophoron daubneyi]|uniref:Regulatory protein SIR2 homolog 7 n=1 Tax=Calicophoron daubneyi TaxID=300641 RepID=A0AAV2TSE1_CALDB
MENDWHNSALKFGELISEHKGRIVVYTGAGISTSANIPDYRGTNGLWMRLKQNTIPDPSDTPKHRRRASCSTSTRTPAKLRLPEATLAKPTFTHMAIKVLVEQGYVKHVVSQNVDGLHLRSGLPREKLSELHGNLFLEQCISCRLIVKRAFDVAENTGRGQHLTGRVCPRCRSLRPSECSLTDRALYSAIEKLKHSKNLAGAERKNYMLARRRAARKLATSQAKQDCGDSCVTKVPLLRDVVVHFHERQPEMGLAEIYRVLPAIEAVHGRTNLYRSVQKCLDQEEKTDLNGHAHLSPIMDAPWFKKMLPAFTLPLPALATSAVNDDSASLIIILGSSLSVLRNYAFLWPHGLGRCLRAGESKERENPGTEDVSSDLISLPNGLLSRNNRCALVIINLQPTCKDGLADLVIHAPCDEVLQVVMNESLDLQVPEYSASKDDPLFHDAIRLDPDEEHTRTRPDIPFDLI